MPTQSPYAMPHIRQCGSEISEVPRVNLGGEIPQLGYRIAELRLHLSGDRNARRRPVIRAAFGNAREYVR
jgi:hypothetical protein